MTKRKKVDIDPVEQDAWREVFHTLMQVEEKWNDIVSCQRYYDVARLPNPNAAEEDQGYQLLQELLDVVGFVSRGRMTTDEALDMQAKICKKKDKEFAKAIAVKSDE